MISGKYRRSFFEMNRTITAEDLEYGLAVLARIIDTQGDAVWPLFERLERELDDIKSRRERVERHLNFKLTRP